ncbi:unnamed protein product [Rotaria sp. Silwood2]|nr:unnamed protein product [Rotaria sp. Silwood2]CAF3222255.1 unnamed protein product [Rotaria sp. Silwood2]CAF3511194.1 unnamed protein product [Rotaria sp. Silwood2]CAF4590201.1 unnamed protein product [Rotaria sp. Silwood2]CAF4622451.1 unnamed protein product [Rotaria sp. Silwood2]
MSSKHSKFKGSDLKEASAVPSEFYFACRNNEIDKVKAMLPKLKLKEIDQIEPNGSTALHAAAYYGHKEIVKMLLSKGAKRTIKNKHGLTPAEEGKDEGIKKMLQTADESKSKAESSPKNENSAGFEWIFLKGDPSVYASFNRESLWKCNSDEEFQRLCRGIRDKYIHEDGPLNSLDGIEEVRKYIDKAISKNEPKYVARAYTANTGFYNRLNRDLSQLPTKWSGEKQERNFASILLFHRVFKPYAYRGETHRGMTMSLEDLNQYVVDSVFMNKTFLSSSTNRSEAEWFSGLSKSSSDIPVICKYTINNISTALKIEEFSKFKKEQEVLILPYAVFKVKNVQKSEGKKGPMVEIDVEEQDQDDDDDNEEDFANNQVKIIKKEKHQKIVTQKCITVHKVGYDAGSNDNFEKIWKNAKEKGQIDLSDLDGVMNANSDVTAWKQKKVSVHNDLKHGKFGGNAITIKHKDLNMNSDDDEESPNMIHASNHQSYTVVKKFNGKESFDMKKMLKGFDSDNDD